MLPDKKINKFCKARLFDEPFQKKVGHVTRPPLHGFKSRVNSSKRKNENDICFLNCSILLSIISHAFRS